MHEDDARLIAEVRAALDEGGANVDAATRARLAQARARALEPRRRHWRWWLPAGGAVFASLLAAVLWLGQPAPVPGNGLDSVTDFELLTANDDLELFEQMDFYRWLEEEGMHAG
jgi:hypothetical protein